jgi:TPR repeat protein
VCRNPAESARYFKLAADEGIAQAQFNYGVRLGEGDDVVQDRMESARYLKLAADQGLLHEVREFQLSLSRLCNTRDDPMLDPIKAAFWYGMAAREGDFGAGLKYAEGGAL